MEQINLHNYEAFFLDYLEGNLDLEACSQLELFLAQHPALEDELKEMGGLDEIVLVPEEKTLGDTSFLKGGDTLNRITEEEWMIKSIEGELTAEQQSKLDAHIKQFQLEKTFKAYQLTKLKANPFIVLNDKAGMKRKETVSIALWMRYSAAASILILLGVVGFSIFQGKTNDPVIGDDILVETENEIRPPLLLNDKEFVQEEVLEAEVKLNRETEMVSVDDLDIEETDSDSIPKMVIPTTPALNEDPIAHIPETRLDTIKQNISLQPEVLEHDDVAMSVEEESHVVTEEPFKIITKATGNFLNREVQYTRDKMVDNNEYVAHHFKLGKFEFERKKSN